TGRCSEFESIGVMRLKTRDRGRRCAVSFRLRARLGLTSSEVIGMVRRFRAVSNPGGGTAEMDRRNWLWLAPGLLLAPGCDSMSHTDKGVLGGGAIGGATGAIIGSATGHTGAGAAIGAGVGALTGGLIGNDVDQSEAKTKAAIAQASATAPAQGPLSLPDI